MTKKRILLIFSGETFKLPPFMTILDSLCDEFSLKARCHETSDNLSKLEEISRDKDVDFENEVIRRANSRDLASRIKGGLNRILK